MHACCLAGTAQRAGLRLFLVPKGLCKTYCYYQLLVVTFEFLLYKPFHFVNWPAVHFSAFGQIAPLVSLGTPYDLSEPPALRNRSQISSVPKKNKPQCVSVVGAVFERPLANRRLRKNRGGKCCRRCISDLCGDCVAEAVAAIDARQAASRYCYTVVQRNATRNCADRGLISLAAKEIVLLECSASPCLTIDPF